MVSTRRSCILVLVACVLTAYGSVQPEPGFSPRNVVRQVQARSEMTGSGSGEPSRAPDRPDDRSPEPGSEQSLDGGGFLIDTSSTLVPAPGSQNCPATAFDGVNFLVAWEDSRSGGYADICGARVTPQGTVLDPSGFVISQAANDQQSPALGFDGANFLVVWQDYRSGYVFNIYGARVTPGGTVLDPLGFPISGAVGYHAYPALAFDGANFLVAWQDYRNNMEEPDLYGARVTPEGAVLDTNGLVITQAARDQSTPALGFDGANFLVVWEDRRSGNFDVYGARVTPEGAVLDTGGFVISQAPDRQDSPALGFDGANLLVVWEDRRSGGNPDIYGARVTPGGTVLDTNGFVITQAPNWQCNPALDFDGANSLVVWEDCRNNPAESDIYGARVTPGGTVLEPDGIVISQASRDQFIPTLAFDGTNFLVVFEDYHRSIFSDIYGARVTPGGVVLDTGGFAIGSAVNDQWFPAVGFNGKDFLVVWEDYRYYRPSIQGAFVTPDGVVADTGWILQQEGHQSHLELARGPDTAMLLVYQGWAGTVQNRMYNTDRIWGAVNPRPGAIAETPNAEVRTTKRGPTIVRGVLFLPRDMTETSDVSDRVPRPVLLDVSGRKVLDLLPGANDVRSLAPGVYFVREAQAQAQAQAQAVRKVVVTR